VAGALPAADIGVFGGTGFYSFLDDVDEVDEVAVQTPFGPPSSQLRIGTLAGRRVAFLARHGPNHEVPPHRINVRANVWAMRRLGVRRLVSPCAVGSLQSHVHPGEFVVLDQLVDRTHGRADTFFDGPVVNSISFADPYCPELRAIAAGAARAEGVGVHERGTVVVIQGPRFSTRAESAWFRSAGWEVINMTQYPEAALARELGMCFCGIASVTDYDTGLEGVDGIEPVTMDAIFAMLDANIERVQGVLSRMVPEIAASPSCSCATGAADPGTLGL
jgi:5'-methylthioadenosine phosphorylase